MLRTGWLNSFRNWLSGSRNLRQARPRGARLRSALAIDVRMMEPRVLLAAAFSEFVDPHPAAGNQFGQTVVVLNTGNVVITSPFDDAGGQDAGAVYLFNGADGTLISTLTGSTANDHLGSDGVVALTNGNFVVASSQWDNAAVVDAGAVTWGNGVNGINGTVSAANSLVGSTTNDLVGQGYIALNGDAVSAITALANGNYVVSASLWDNAAAVDAGAATWGNGTVGVSGAIAAANSLVGTTAGDGTGADLNGGTGVTELTNGNYVVVSGGWSNGANAFAGAVTWANGTTGMTGAVTAGNSLVGTSALDGVGTDLNGDNAVTLLTNGNYVVSSPAWANGAATGAGAVTWGNGTTGVVGPISLANSLLGIKAGDGVGAAFNGENGVAALTNGNFVVSSARWDSALALDVGAVTWVNGATGGTGTLNNGNSLVGTTANDFVGSFAATALTNGNFVVSSTAWTNGAATQAGAVTWGNGTTGIVGAVSAANSLVGTTINDAVGFLPGVGDGVLALTNGNYVVSSSLWDNAAIVDAGAVTWGNGTTGTVGAVAVANSLVGTTANDRVGTLSANGVANGVTPLTNGNYVVSSDTWDNGAIVDAGAATWGNGTMGVSGAVTPANSLVGTSANDIVGVGGVTPLTNGNYVVNSFNWNNNQGAVTFGNGATGMTGAVSFANSLVGTNQDYVGGTNSSPAMSFNGVTALPNGNYVVASGVWNNGAAAMAGAVTIGNGLTGTPGPVTAANSLIGSTAFDRTGDFGMTVLANGNYVFGSPTWTNGANANAGAVTFGSGNTGVTGPITTTNSTVGLTANAGLATATVNGGTVAPIVVDDINGNFFAQFVTEGGGHVRVGSQVSGFANVAPTFHNQVLFLTENSPAGTVVPYTAATDTDAGQTLTYAITAGNTKNAFAINPMTGQITVNNPAALDFENDPPFNLTVTATDNGTPVLSTAASIRIFLTDANDAPIVYNHTISLAENSPNGTNVFNYSQIPFDQDTGQTLTYAITAGNTGNAFAINPATGHITVNDTTALDYENKPPFVLTISVTDNGNPALTSSAKLGIKLLDVNDAPHLYNHTISLAENTAAGANVFNYALIATDQDVGQTLSYAITGGNTGNAFAINAITGQITVNNPAVLDFENTPPFVLTISVTDNGNPALTSSALLGIKLTNVNDAPIVYNHTIAIAENLANGTNVFNYSVIASDQDVGQSLTYAITAGNTANAFAINAATGQITVNNSAALDFENMPPFVLTIAVTDNGNPALTSSAKLGIKLTDANDAPRVYNHTISIAENLANGSNVFNYSLIAADQDAGQTRTYAITAGNTANAFAINATTGQITVNNSAALDFENTPPFVLTISVTDNGTPALTSAAQLGIKLTDVNDAPLLYNHAVTIPENSVAGTNVLNYSLIAKDQDAGQTLTYAITAGNRNNTFAINAATGQITVANAAGLDFENEPFYNLTIQVTDNGNPALSSTASLVVSLSNVNDAPLLYNATVKIPEHSAAGTTVLAYNTVAFDQDKGQTLTYAITAGNTGDAFTINATTGLIAVKTSSVLDFATTPTFNLTISVTDNGNPALTSTAQLTVNLTKVSQPPAIVPATFAVKTGAAAGTVVGTVTSTDPDGGGPPVYTNVSSNSTLRDAFVIDSTTGVITTTQSLLFFVPPGTYDLTIRVADSLTPTLSSTGTIKVQVNSTGVVV